MWWQHKFDLTLYWLKYNDYSVLTYLYYICYDFVFWLLVELLTKIFG